jgi:hypothetical protein
VPFRSEQAAGRNKLYCIISGLGVSPLSPIGGRLLRASDRADARPCGKSQPLKCEL